VRDSGSGRVIALVLVFVLLVGGAVVGLKTYQKFTPTLLGGGVSPTTKLQADHMYNLPLRYTLGDPRGVRIDAIHIPVIKGLDLTVTGVDCNAEVANKPLTEGPNLGNGVYAPNLSPKAYFAQIVRKIYGSKLGTPKNPATCAVLAIHSREPGSYHIGALRIDWRAGLFVGHVHDHTDISLTFVASS
jgi:hypothetical protein